MQDTLRLGPIRASAIIGCENAASGNIFIEPSDGIMGLGLGQISVFSQMVDAQLVTDQFAVCLGPIGAEYSVAVGPGVNPNSAAENGAIVFGSLAGTDVENATDVQWTPLVRSLVCWTSYLVQLNRITVGGRDIGETLNASTAEARARPPTTPPPPLDAYLRSLILTTV